IPYAVCFVSLGRWLCHRPFFMAGLAALVGLRANVTDFLRLRQSIKAAEFVHAPGTIALQAIAQAVTEASREIIGSAVTLELVRAHVRVETDPVEQPAVQPARELEVLLLQGHQ